MGNSSKKVLLLGFLSILLISGFAAQDNRDDDPHSLGLIPLDEKQNEEIVRTWPRISRVEVNWLGLKRVNRVRVKKGKAPLTSGFAKKVGHEFESVVGQIGPAAATASVDSELLDDLPPVVDNSTTKYFPPIRSQGSLGSCASFATTYTQYSYMRAFQQDLDLRDNNDNTNKFSPKWSYNVVNNGVNQGSTLPDNYELFEKHGACTWAEFPYDADYLAWCLNGTAWRNAISVRTNHAVYTDTNFDVIKQLLTNGYILVFATYIYSWDFKTILDDPSTTDDDAEIGKAVAYWMNGKSGPHAMTLVGYNDSIWTDINSNGAIDPGEKGAFRIANSWGTGWQDGGLAWAAYDAFRNPSAVPGIPPTTTKYGIFADNRAYVLTVRDNYEPRMLAEFTVNHAKRNQLRMRLGYSTTSQDWPSTLWQPVPLDLSCGPYAFNGSTTAIDGTFVLDFTDLITTSGAVRRFYVYMNDTTLGDVATLSALKFIDATTDSYTEIPYSPLPQYADHQERFFCVDYTFSGPTYNHPPLLPELPGVFPSIGAVAEPFTYSIYYTDQDGDAPAVKTVYVDGVPYPMYLWSGTPSDGQYRYDTTLSLGTHNYRFYFEDGRGGSASNPYAGMYTGPTVVLEHFVTRPGVPSGETAIVSGTSHVYATVAGACNLGHSIQHQFDWGDGAVSDWLTIGQTSAAHTWVNAGTYQVRARSRCISNQAVVSGWSEPMAVTVISPSVADFNDDGLEDILWRYYGTGGYIRTWYLGDTEGAGLPLSIGVVATPNYDKTSLQPGMRAEKRSGINEQARGMLAGRMRVSASRRGRDPMVATNRQARPGMVDDPRRAGAGRALVRPQLMGIADPRQVRLALSGEALSGLPEGPLGAPLVLGGGDVMAVADLSWQIVGTGDFDNDTHVDILWRNSTTGINVVWLMNGTEWRESAELLPVGDQTWQIVGTGDFNNDTHVDILWRNSVTGANVVWYMDGTAWIGSAVLLGVTDQSWQIVGTGDFNNDTHVDILWRNSVSGSNVVWYMSGANWSGTAELIPVGDPAWQIVGTGDYNSDGNVDILWRYNGPGGYNVIWYMSGVTWSSSAELLPVPDLNWRIVSR